MSPPIRVECRGRRVTFIAEEQVLPNNHKIIVDRVVFPQAVAILPIYTQTREIILIEQYRPAIGETILEAPAGVVDPGETPEQAAARELEEETGLKPSRLIHIATAYTSPGYTTEKIHYYIAPNPQKTRPHTEPHEIIKTRKLTLTEAQKQIQQQKIKDTKTILLILATTTLKPI